MKLTNNLSNLLLLGARTVGSYEPEEVLSYVEESMTVRESSAAWEFLTWVSANDKTFGHGNIQQVWKEWQDSQ